MNYILYCVLALSIIALPGPGILLTITTSLKTNWTKTFINISGLLFGLLVLSTLTIIGLNALVKTVPILLSIIQVLASLYLLYLGYFKLTHHKRINKNKDLDTDSFHIFKNATLLSLLGTKPLLFFVTVVPEFITNESEYLKQSIILFSIFLFLVLVIHLSYALFASFFKSKLQDNEKLYFKIDIFTGTLFILIALAILYKTFLPI